MMADGQPGNRSGDVRLALANIDAELGRITGSADQEFLKIGSTLGHAVDVFGQLAGKLGELAGHLHGAEAKSAVASLEEAIGTVGRISMDDDTSRPLLGELDGYATDLAKRLGLLGRIIGEIRSLAINGKIQSAMVSNAGVDFSVFTKEIGRLGQMAENSIGQASGRLESVARAVASAIAAAEAFRRNEAKELEAVQTRIKGSLASLADQRHKAAAAADSVAGKSLDISRRIAATVAELQINDSVSQRLEHTRIALRAMAELSVGASIAEPGLDWLNQIPQERQSSLAAGVCSLQLAQLRGSGSDYHDEVESLIANLKALSAMAGEIRNEAESAFSGGGGLFVAEITQDVRRAIELLSAYSTAREKMAEVMMSVSGGFQAMTEDLAAIQSIDADMRVMGLNATLKCGRLGKDGLALGVVAHEIRGCSKRTEDCTHGIVDLLSSALRLAGSLSGPSDAEQSARQENPLDAMSRSIKSLANLGAGMESAMSELRASAGEVAGRLWAAANEVDIHGRLCDVTEEAATALEQLANGLWRGKEIAQADHQDIIRLMQPLYTMERERAIHRGFIGHGELAAALHAPEEPAEESVEDLFF